MKTENLAGRAFVCNNRFKVTLNDVKWTPSDEQRPILQALFGTRRDKQAWERNKKVESFTYIDEPGKAFRSELKFKTSTIQYDF